MKLQKPSIPHKVPRARCGLASHPVCFGCFFLSRGLAILGSTEGAFCGVCCLQQGRGELPDPASKAAVDGEEEAVQVAVRMRPFNGREKAANSTRVVRMENLLKGSKTYVTDPDSGEEREFKYDFSFQSHSEARARSLNHGCTCLPLPPATSNFL